MHFILFYDYVDDILEKRTPYREGHLALIKEYMAAGKMLMAGALTDPVDGGVLIFKADGRDSVEAFVNSDPYVAAGLVTGWRIREWAVVNPS